MYHRRISINIEMRNMEVESIQEHEAIVFSRPQPTRIQHSRKPAHSNACKSRKKREITTTAIYRGFRGHVLRIFFKVCFLITSQ